jgi:hypothetical protein
VAAGAARTLAPVAWVETAAPRVAALAAELVGQPWAELVASVARGSAASGFS